MEMSRRQLLPALIDLLEMIDGPESDQSLLDLGGELFVPCVDDFVNGFLDLLDRIWIRSCVDEVSLLDLVDDIFLRVRY